MSKVIISILICLQSISAFSTELNVFAKLKSLNGMEGIASSDAEATKDIECSIRVEASQNEVNVYIDDTGFHFPGNAFIDLKNYELQDNNTILVSTEGSEVCGNEGGSFSYKKTLEVLSHGIIITQKYRCLFSPSKKEYSVTCLNE